MSKILMVTERYLPIWGGAENQLRQLIPHLHSNNHKVNIVTRRWHADLLRDDLVDEVSVIRLGIPGETHLATLIFICQLFIFLIWYGRKFDIFHSHGAVKMGVICRIASLLTGKKNIVKIATAGKISSLQTSLPGRMLLYFFKKSDAVICMTTEIEKELACIRFPIEKTANIPNAVDCDRFSRQVSVTERKRFRRSFDIPEDALLFVFTGRLVHRKGLDVLVKAWRELVSTRTNIYLLIIGSGKGQTDSIEAEIKNLINDEQINNIVFIGETDEPELFLANCDIFVFPSRQEGFPNSLMEAMASELPVVASRIGGNIDLIDDGRTGILFQSDNYIELSKCLDKLCTDNAKVVMIGQNARELMVTRYSFPPIAQLYSELYFQLK